MGFHVYNTYIKHWSLFDTIKPGQPMGSCYHKNKLYIIFSIIPLGSGSFGKVVRGKAISEGGESESIVIKQSNTSHIDALCHEYDILKYLAKQQVAGGPELFYDDNIMRVGGFAMILFKYNHGDVPLSILVKCRKFIRCTADDIAFQQALIVQGLHENNVIHCDIKEDNFLFNVFHKNVVLIDYGEAFILKPNMPFRDIKKLSYIPGTAGYIAPELVLDHRIYKKSDIWSLGVIYTMMLGNASHDDWKQVDFTKDFKKSDIYKNIKNNMLIKNMLEINMSNRISAKQCVQKMTQLFKKK